MCYISAFPTNKSISIVQRRFLTSLGIVHRAWGLPGTSDYFFLNLFQVHTRARQASSLVWTLDRKTRLYRVTPHFKRRQRTSEENKASGPHLGASRGLHLLFFLRTFSKSTRTQTAASCVPTKRRNYIVLRSVLNFKKRIPKRIMEVVLDSQAFTWCPCRGRIIALRLGGTQ
jgi:hypothetical protein